MLVVRFRPILLAVRASAVAIIFLGLAAAPAHAQSVSAKDGNIVFAGQNGPPRQITTSHLDYDPSLSFDNRHVVFVRRTHDHMIKTFRAPVDGNELWIASADGSSAPRRVLVGHPGGFKIGPKMVLADLVAPQFSPDGKRIYFVAGIRATEAAIYMLDLASGKATFLYSGLGMEVIKAGERRGFLIGVKSLYPDGYHNLRVLAARPGRQGCPTYRFDIGRADAIQKIDLGTRAVNC